MDYSIQKSLHERSLSILELRENAVKHLDNAIKMQTDYNNATNWQKLSCYYGPAELAWEIKKWTRGVSFIEGIYERHMWKMRDTIPWKSAMLCPTNPHFFASSEEVPKVEYWETP